MPRAAHAKSGFATTRSPTATRVTRLPASTTVPTFSWPMTNGNDEKGDADGETCSDTKLRSLPQIPPKRVAMRTQLALGSDGAATFASCVQRQEPVSKRGEIAPAARVAR